MHLKRLARIALISICFASFLNAQSGASLTSSIKDAAVAYASPASTGRAIAVLTFPALDGRVSLLSSFVSEQLSIDLANALGTRGSVVERSQVQQVLQEERLIAVGLTSRDAARIGKKLGATHVLVGTITILGSQVLVNSRLVSTDNAAMAQVFRIEGIVPTELLKLDNQAVTARSVAEPSDNSEIAAKNAGRIRVVLKSVSEIRLDGAPGGSALRAIFELSNRDVTKPIAIGANARSPEPRQDAVGSLLRTTVVDEAGNSWVLPTANVTGIGVVGVGWTGSDRQSVFEPSDIARLLDRQDRDGSNQATDPRFIGVGNTYHFVYGTMTQLSAGDVSDVILTFVRQNRSSQAAASVKNIQIGLELVVGNPNANGKQTYAIQNVTFENVRMVP